MFFNFFGDHQTDGLNNVYEELTSERYSDIAPDDPIDLRGVIGAPPSFSELADFRMRNVNRHGNEYVRKFIEEGNFVAMEVGQPKLHLDDDEAAEISVSEDSGDTDILKGLIETMQNAPNRQLFGFRSAMDKYWKDVRLLAGAMAYMLGLEDAGDDHVGSLLGFGGSFHNFDWGQYQSDFVEEEFQGGRNWSYVPFYNNGIIESDESISHSTGPTSIENNINNNALTNNPLANTAKEFAMLTGQELGDSMEELERYSEEEGVMDQSLLQSIQNALPLPGGGMAGLAIKMNLPDIWQDTNYSRQYNLRFKFTTPHGDPLSVYLNVLVPIAHILPLVTARQLAFSNTYIGSYILRIFSEGMVNIKLGMATNVSIERNQEAVSMDGLPTEVDVTVTITDLFPMLGLPYEMSWGSLAKSEGLMGYLGTLCGYNAAYYDIREAIDLQTTATFEDLVGQLRPTNISQRMRTRLDVQLQRAGQDLAQYIF